MTLRAQARERLAERAARAAHEDRLHLVGMHVMTVQMKRHDDAGARHRRAEEAAGSTPPAFAFEHRMTRRLPGGELAHEAGERSGAGLRCTHVERAGLVVAAAFAHEAVPVERSEQRPYRDGAPVDAARARAL